MSSTAECIHGFEAGLCDTCYPKAPPEKPRVVKTPTRKAAVSTRTPRISTADQRVYHVTHLSNLEAIVAEGLRADATPVVDVSSALARELRRDAEAAPGEPVSGFVPFYLAPDADRWVDLRDGALDPAWSDAARAATSTDFVFLVSTLEALGPDAIVTDGDAAGSVTRFASGEQVGRMLVRLHDTDSRASAEALVSGSVPWSSIQLIGVASEKVRDRVRALTSTKVAVYPPWFVG